MALNFNVDPYYDDFDPTKNFHRVLFKPGYAVQARELTQSQTILQDQVSKFGNGIYQDGSKVSGGNITVDTNIITAKLTTASTSDISNYKNLFAVGVTSGFVAQVIEVDINNLYIKTKAVNIGNKKSFSSGETINFYVSKVDALSSLYSPATYSYQATAVTENVFQRTATGTYLSNQLNMSVANISVGDTITDTVTGLNAVVISIIDANNLVINQNLPKDFSNYTLVITNKCSVRAMEVGIDAGVWFSSGFFISNPVENIIPDALNAYPSVVIGFEVNETIVDSVSDVSLLDPAIGASNYQAPGADRYQISLTLISQPYVSQQVVNSLTTNKFIELVRINQGIVEKINNVPGFTTIQESIAQAVYDQSGDFIVTPYSLVIGNSPPSADYLPASITAGKAYFQGYPVEHIAPTQYLLEKARDTTSVSNIDITSYYGDYTRVTNLGGSGGFIDFQHGSQVELHNVAANAANTNTLIGRARVRNFDYDSGNNASTAYKAFLFDVKLNSGTFANVLSLMVPGVGNNYSSPIFTSNTVSQTNLVDATYNSLIFPFEQKNISTVSQVNYNTRRYYSTLGGNMGNFASGVVTIQTNGTTETFVGGGAGGIVASSDRQINYGVIVTSSSGAYSAGQFIPMDQANVTITINNSAGTPTATLNIGGNYSGAGTLYATIDVTGDVRKTKTLLTNQTVTVSANTYGTPIDIGYSDIYNFDQIIELGNTGSYIGNWSNTTTYQIYNVVYNTGDGNYYYSTTNSNVGHSVSDTSHWAICVNAISNFGLDNGQRDTFYDHGKITNLLGGAIGNVLVVFDYFTHSGGTGYFDVDSYPDYNSIPNFTSPQYGTTYNLRDVLDFRPRRTDNSTGLVGFQLPQPFHDAYAYYSYYLSRIDKIALYQNGQFKTIRGISSYTNPIPPSDIPDALTLFTVSYPAYTFKNTDVVNTPTTLKRYTMRDIGVLDKRISNMEYYAVLSLAENQITGSDVTDSTGTNILFKNGYLVDNFTGHGVGDVGNPDYSVSIDFTNQFARPLFSSKSIGIVAPTYENYGYYSVDTTQNAFQAATPKTNNKLALSNNVVSFSYTTTPLVIQNVATQIINVNPFDVVSFVGDVSLTPSSDTWMDTKTQPAVTIVNEDQAAWIAAVNGTGNGTQWNDWQINWSGQNPVSVNNQEQISRDTQAITQAIAAKGLNGATSGGNIQVSTTTQVISTSIVPYARSIPVKFTVKGLAPGATIHTFINGTVVDSYVTPDQSSTNISSTFQGAPLITNVNGTISGTLTIPGGTDPLLKFPTGTLNIEFSDNLLNPKQSSTYAVAPFVSTGTLSTVQTTIVSTKPPTVVQKQTNNTTTNVTQPLPSGSVPSSATTTTAYPVAAGIYTPGSTTVQNTTVNGVTTNSEYYANVSHVISYGTAFAQNCYAQVYGANAASNLANGIASTIGTAYPEIWQLLVNNTGSLPTGDQVLAVIQYGVNDYIASGNSKSNTVIIQDMFNAINTAGTNASTSANNYINANFKQFSTAEAYASSVTCAQGGGDPLSQNFFVDSNKFPNGIFLSDVGVYFVTKDPTIPVSIRIRPTVNGYPDAVNNVPDSIVYLNPSDVNVPNVNSQTTQIGPVTTFKFKYPIYLAPGQYSLMVAAESNQYQVYASKTGESKFGTSTEISQVTYGGVLFKSQNSQTWVPAVGEQLCFNINICDFAGGTASFDIKSSSSDTILFDTLELRTQELTFNTFDSISYQMTTKSPSGVTYGPTNIYTGQNYNFNTRQQQINAGDIIISPTMTNLDRYTSPILDLERLSTRLIQNIITPYYAANTTSELLPGFYNGGAAAKYITRRVTLDVNMLSTGLTVYLDVNRQPGTKIEVYCKVMNSYDTNNFDNNSYQLMNQILSSAAGVVYTGPTDFTTDTYQKLNITYNDQISGSQYKNFNIFAIKIVMYSSNPAIVPEIKNLRVVATA